MESSGFHGEIQALGISPRPGCWELFSEMWEVVTISRYERRMRLGLESDVQGFQENGFYKVEKKIIDLTARIERGRTKRSEFGYLWLVAAGMGKEKGTERRGSVKDRTKGELDHIFGMMEHLFGTWGSEKPHRAQ